MAACGGSAEPQFSVSETNVIRQRTSDFAAAFNGKDIDKIIGFYSPETVFMPPNSPALRGRDSLGGFYKDLYAQGATELKMDSTTVGGHGPLAYESGTYSLNRRPPSGAHTRDRGKYMFIWRNINGQWLIENTMWSSDLPERVDIAPSK
jgi:ketosteroid isomerase-like protein